MNAALFQCFNVISMDLARTNSKVDVDAIAVTQVIPFVLLSCGMHWPQPFHLSMLYPLLFLRQLRSTD